MILHSPSVPHLVNWSDCQSVLERLFGNLSGFVYRRRHDPRWTMEFVSAKFRDVTGYDPHRFAANGSIAFRDLIAPSDWSLVNERVRLAVLHRHRAAVTYPIRTAHGAWVQVEDRFTPVADSTGRVIAIEGVIDRTPGVQRSPARATRSGPPAGLDRPAGCSIKRYPKE